MMPLDIRSIQLFMVFVATVIVAGVFILQPSPAAYSYDPPGPMGPGGELEPPDNVTLTCYKWVENGSARVQCPDTVGVGETTIRIDVKHCSDYRYRVDERRPCGG